MKYLIGLMLVGSFLFSQGQDNKFSRPDLPGDLMVDIGINSWSTVPDTLDTRGWASKSIGLYYTQRFAIGRKLSFYPGLGFGLEKIGFDNNVTLVDSVSSRVTLLSLGTLRKNKLAVTYLDVPLEFRFHPKGTQDGEGLFVGVGGIFGLRMNAHTKWKFDDGRGNKIIKESGKFSLQNYRYGYQIRIGFKGVHFFYKRHLSEMFQRPIDGVNPTLTTIGINLTGF